MKPQHTPTPWEVEHTDDGYIRIINDNGDIPVEDSGNGQHPIIVSTEDAAFIVRAVNMHSELVSRLRTCMAYMEAKGEQPAWVNETKAIIARAEGKGEQNEK